MAFARISNGEQKMIPETPQALLTRAQTAIALTQSGFPVKAATLATKASRGGGPPYRLFGNKPLYRWAYALEWAEARLGKPRRTSSEPCAQTNSRNGGDLA